MKIKKQSYQQRENTTEAPFCWQNKLIKKFIRKSSPTSKRKSCLGIYDALTELSSDQGMAMFDCYIGEIAHMSGYSVRNIGNTLKELSSIGVIRLIPQRRTADGKFTEMTVILLSYSCLPSEFLGNFRKKDFKETSDITNKEDKEKINITKTISSEKKIDMSKEIGEIASLKAAHESGLSLEQATFFVKRDIKAFGGPKEWFRIYTLQKTRGLPFYNHISIKVQGGMTVDEALSDWDRKH